jgi:hypothetical protein
MTWTEDAHPNSPVTADDVRDYIRRGWDTHTIASVLHLDESQVWNLLARQRSEAPLC